MSRHGRQPRLPLVEALHALRELDHTGAPITCDAVARTAAGVSSSSAAADVPESPETNRAVSVVVLRDSDGGYVGPSPGCWSGLGIRTGAPVVGPMASYVRSVTGILLTMPTFMVSSLSESEWSPRATC